MNNTEEIIKVGIAEMKVVKAPDLIRTTGLGSCVGVVVFDPLMKIAGMAHVMLPDSSLAKSHSVNLAKYADTAVVELVSTVIKQGARKVGLKAKIAGGAQMFQFSTGNEMMRIGPRNIEAVKNQLANLHILLVGEDVGGHSGRTIQFDPNTGILQIRTVNKGISYL